MREDATGRAEDLQQLRDDMLSNTPHSGWQVLFQGDQLHDL